MVYKFFENNLVEVVLLMNQIFNWQMNFINKLFRKLKKRKVYASFRDNIWDVDLADIQSLSRYNERIKYSLCEIDIFSKYAWIIPLKDKRVIRIVNAFQKINSQGRKLNKTWVDNNSFKDFLKIDSIEMYSTYNEQKSVVAERFIRTLKSKISQHITAI